MSVKRTNITEDLGIRLSSKKEEELFKWFLACLLFGKPIQQQVAERAFLTLAAAQGLWSGRKGPNYRNGLLKRPSSQCTRSNGFEHAGGIAWNAGHSPSPSAFPCNPATAFDQGNRHLLQHQGSPLCETSALCHMR